MRSQHLVYLEGWGL